VVNRSHFHDAEPRGLDPLPTETTTDVAQAAVGSEHATDIVMVDVTDHA
jgi:hypothetical protein